MDFAMEYSFFGEVEEVVRMVPIEFVEAGRMFKINEKLNKELINEILSEPEEYYFDPDLGDDAVLYKRGNPDPDEEIELSVIPATGDDDLTVRGTIRGIVVDFEPPHIEDHKIIEEESYEFSNYDVGWSYTELHISTELEFEIQYGPGGTLKAIGNQGHFEITDELEAGEEYWIRVVHVDTTGQKSDPSPAKSATAGRIITRDIDFEAISALRTTDLYTNTITTDSASYVSVPDMDLEYTAEESGIIFIVASCPASAYSFWNARRGVSVRLVINEEEFLAQTDRRILGFFMELDQIEEGEIPKEFHIELAWKITDLEEGEEAGDGDWTATAGVRFLSMLHIKR